MRIAALIASFGLLAACAAPEPPAPYISDKARAALPPGTDLSTVKRREDGCYLIVIEDDLSGVIRPLKDENGFIVCDDV